MAGDAEAVRSGKAQRRRAAAATRRHAAEAVAQHLRDAAGEEHQGAVGERERGRIEHRHLIARDHERRAIGVDGGAGERVEREHIIGKHERLCPFCHSQEISVAEAALTLPGRLQDQARDRVGLRDQGQVARLHLDRLGAHALGHETLEVRIDGPVLRRNRVPARLRPPRGVRGLVGEQRLLERDLDRVEDARFVRRQIAGEVAQECLLAQPALIVRPDDAGEAGGVGKPLARAV